MQTVDLLVIGGGPAGTATAMNLARAGLSVTLLERTGYHGLRIGETLPPRIREPLSELGLWERFLATAPNPSFANRSAWGSPVLQHQDFVFDPYGSGWHIDRRAFDRMLAAAAGRAGATIWTGARLQSIRRESGVWSVAATCGNEQITMRAGLLVDACGRRSTVARKLRRRQRAYDRLIGIAGFLAPTDDGHATTNTLLLESVRDGWWYSVPLADGTLLAVLMTDADLLRGAAIGALGFWRHHLRASVHTRARLQDRIPPAEVTIRAANSVLMEEPSGRGYLAVGDAAMALDPLSSQGIERALRSGIRAGNVVASGAAAAPDGCPAYDDTLRREFDEYLKVRSDYYGAETRWKESPFWQRRFQPNERRRDV